MPLASESRNNLWGRHWPEYAIEAALLGTFMLSACLCAVLLFYPHGRIAQAIPDLFARRVLMGLAMGSTAVALNYSPWGKRSGAHYNPAVTLTFMRLGKIAPGDALGYVAAQFAGAVIGVFFAGLVVRKMLAHSEVHFAVTRPGAGGALVAFIAEGVISGILMLVVLTSSNRDNLARYTGLFAGLLVATFITVEAPLSGMSMNPARTVGSGFWAGDWTALWIYFTAPPLGMLLAAELYIRRHGEAGVFCAKLHHQNQQRCIFCEYRSALGTFLNQPALHPPTPNESSIRPNEGETRMRRRTWVVGLAVLGGIGWYAFRPELLFVRKQVNEGLPVAAAQAGPTATTTQLLVGRFNSVAHETRGSATIYRLADAKRVLRLTDFATSNGPDVRVYLVAAADARDDETVKRAGFVELGKLKGTDGDQNYEVPADLDLEQYRAVTIWCRRFAVNFGTAPLAPPQNIGVRKFIIRVQNISQGEALKLSNGKSAPFVSAPVLWVIHSGGKNPIFSSGKPDAGAGLELLAETGNPTELVKALGANDGITQAGADAKPVGADSEGPLFPGQQYEFEISARPGELLSTAWMFGQSNDLFYSNDRPIALFTSSGQPVSGEMTARLFLWDAGTEMNEEPGLGPNQGPRQATPDAGSIERKAIAHVRDRYRYPRTGDVLRLTITPVAAAMSIK